MEKLSENNFGNMHSNSLKSGMIGFWIFWMIGAAATFGNNWTAFTIFSILCLSIIVGFSIAKKKHERYLVEDVSLDEDYLSIKYKRNTERIHLSNIESLETIMPGKLKPFYGVICIVFKEKNRLGTRIDFVAKHRKEKEVDELILERMKLL